MNDTVEIIATPNHSYDNWYKLFIFDSVADAVKGIKFEGIHPTNVVAVRVFGKSNQELLAEFRGALCHI